MPHKHELGYYCRNLYAFVKKYENDIRYSDYNRILLSIALELSCYDHALSVATVMIFEDAEEVL